MRIAGRQPFNAKENSSVDRVMYKPETNIASDTNETEKGNGETEKTETRKVNTPINVWVTPGEKWAI
jgi:hypothetical protein